MLAEYNSRFHYYTFSSKSIITRVARTGLSGRRSRKRRQGGVPHTERVSPSELAGAGVMRPATLTPLAAARPGHAVRATHGRAGAWDIGSGLCPRLGAAHV